MSVAGRVSVALAVSLACIAALPVAALAAQAVEPLQAPATQESFVIEHRVVSVRVLDRDRLERSVAVRVWLKEASALALFGELVVPYTDEHQRVTLARLTIEREGRVIDLTSTPASDISVNLGPDQRAKHVAIPGLVVGDRVEYDVRITDERSLSPGHFAYAYSFIRWGAVREDVFEVDVPADAGTFVKAQPGLDATHETSTRDGRRISRWTTSVPKSMTADELNDPERLELAYKAPNDVVVTSFASWQQFAAWYGPTLARQAAVTPAIAAKARALTVSATTPRERLDALHAFVARDVRYLALPLGVRRFEPRPAADVLLTAYGDCKDKYVLLAALASAVGLVVNPALIHSVQQLDDDVASITQFDHLIGVWQPGGGIRDTWLDPTVSSAPVGALMPQLRGRRAVVLAARDWTGTPTDTPADLASPGALMTRVTGTIAASGAVVATLARTMTGDPELALRHTLVTAGAESLQAVADSFVKEDGLAGVARDVTTSDLASVGAPLRIEFTAGRSITPEAMANAWTFTPPAPKAPLPKVRAGDGKPLRKAPLVLGSPFRMHTAIAVTLAPGMTATAPAPVSLATPFATYTANYEVKGQALVATRELVSLVHTISPDAFADYEAFVAAVAADEKQAFAMGPFIDVASVIASGSADTLNALGRAAIVRGDVDNALRMLKRATEIAPAHRFAWNNLGWAYMTTRDYEQAAAAFRSQLEASPGDEYAYGQLGMVYRFLGRHAEAADATRRYLEAKPLDQFAYLQLVGALISAGRQDEAMAAAERSVKLATPDVRTVLLLAQGYAMRQRQDEAVATLDRAVDSLRTPFDFAVFAGALVQFGQADRAHRYAQRALSLAKARFDEITLVDSVEEVEQLAAVVSMSFRVAGWVHQQGGRAREAREMFEAAWTITRDGRSAILLSTQLPGSSGQASQRAKELRAVAHVWRGRPPSTPSPLDVLVSDPVERERLVQGVPAMLELEGRVAIPGVTGPLARARLLVSFSGAGVIDEARVIGGAEALRPQTSKLAGAKRPFAMPAGHAIRLVLPATLSCTGRDAPCQLVLDVVDPDPYARQP